MKRTKKVGWGRNSVHLRRPRFAGAPTRQQVLDQNRARLQEEDGSNLELIEFGRLNS
jgi:hypothetical protein